MENPKLALIPSGYKGGTNPTVYSILPNDATGDFDFDRASEGTRVRKDGLIEEVTNDVPRLDWLNSNCPSLLLQPQRTNTFIYSEQFNYSGWFKSNCTITTNQIIAPNGTLTADLATSTANGGGIYRFSSWSTSQKTASIFVKKNTSSTAEIFNSSSASNRVVFNLDSGTITTEGGNMTGTIEDFGNGWFRLSATHTASANQTFALKPATNESLYVWGAQLEDGSYASSYIKTEASTVTRLKDNCHLLNQTLFTDYPFTVYAKAKVDAINNTVFGLVNSTNSNTYLIFYFSSSTQVGVIRRIPSAADSDFYNFTYSVGDIVKVAIAFINETSYKLYINGTELGSVTSGTSIQFQHDDICLGQLRIASDTGSRNSIDDFRVYDYTLTDTKLTELTTL